MTALVAGLMALPGVSDGAWLSVAVGWSGSSSSAVGPGSAPTATASVRTVSLSWPAATLDTGAAVTGYVIRQYDAATSIERSVTASSCAGVITGVSCTHTAAPTGSWRYTVTPAHGQWRGAESPGAPVVVDPSVLSLSAGSAVRPGVQVSGTLSGFVPGQSVSYRLDSATGTAVSGTLQGAPTPGAVVPASGGGAVTLTIPAGTPDGLRPVIAVASGGDTAAYSVVVDATPPPAPVFTRTPPATSGSTVSFEFTEQDSSAALDCQLDAAAYAPCASPVDLVDLTAGTHTFRVRATDPAGNASLVERTWTVDVGVPNVAVSFPSAGARVNDAGLGDGCATPSGDLCGTADDNVTAVSLTLRRVSGGLYWNGTAFASTATVVLAATGTTDWSYTIAAADFLTEGDYTLQVTATDGTAPDGVDTRTFTVDRSAPPAPTFTAAPTGTTGSVVSVAHASTDPAATFECRLDGAVHTACLSPRTLSGLGDGTHALAVRAVDVAGNRSPETSVSWTVDAVAPELSISLVEGAVLTPAAYAAACGTPAGDLCGTSADGRSGPPAVSVAVRRTATGLYFDGSAFAATSETFRPASGSTPWSYALSAGALQDGGYTISSRAVDGVGNSTTLPVTLTLDGTPPGEPELLSAPTSPGGSTAVFDLGTPEPGASVQCRLDGAAWAACTSPVTYPGLPSGLHAFEVRAVDSAGNTSTVRRHTWTVDPDLPSVAFSFPAAGGAYSDARFDAGCGTPSGDLCGTASDPQGVIGVELSVRRDATGQYWDGSAFTPGAERWVPATGTSSWRLSLSAASLPAEGSYTIRVRAADAAGNLATDTLHLVLDRTAPAAPTITSGPTGTTKGADTFAFTGEAGAGFTCRIDSGPSTACASPYAATTGAGLHVFEVQAVDPAGNTGLPASRSWAVDATAPTVVISFAADSARHNDATFTAGCGTAGTGDVCGTASDPGVGVASVRVALRQSGSGSYWNGTSFGAAAPTYQTATGTTTWSLPFAAPSFPTDGTYVLSVVGTDSAGNASAPVSTTFAIDRTGPSANSVAAINRGVIPQMIETGDQLLLTFSEPIEPTSLIAGWDGRGTQIITIRQANNTTDLLTFYNGPNKVRLPLGSVSTGRGDFVNNSVVWGATATRSTISLSGTTLTLTFGTPSAANRVTPALGTGNMTWSPRAGVAGGAGVKDTLGNLGTSTGRSETDLDGDF